MSASGESNDVVAGDGADQGELDRIAEAIGAGPQVEKLLHMKVVRLADDELLVAAKVALVSDRSLLEVADDLQIVRERIRDAVPQARGVYLEPDVHRAASEPAPPTDVFVLKSAD